MKLFIYSLCVLLSLNVAADTQTKDTNNSLTQKIEAIDYDLLELETQLDMGMDAFEVGLDASKIQNQLLYFEYQLGTLHGGDQQWNESEQMILDAKVKLEALPPKSCTLNLTLPQSPSTFIFSCRASSLTLASRIICSDSFHC